MSRVATPDEGQRGDPTEWRDVEFEIEGFLGPKATVAILTYRARATRGDDERYRALVSTTRGEPIRGRLPWPARSLLPQGDEWGARRGECRRGSLPTEPNQEEAT